MRKDKTSIVFTGDIGFDRYMDHRWEDDALLSQPILDFFHGADHVAANVEGALIDAVDDGSRGVFFHAMNPAATKVLKDMHADIWCVGNNHTMDAGKEGVISTRKIAQEMGCLTIGAGLNEVEASEPIYLDEAGGIGMFGVAYMAECIPATATEPGIFRWDDMDYIKRRIDEVKAKCRWCVVVSHGGEEFTSMPSPYTRDRYLRYLELGADVVVAHHPHVPENYELFPDGKAIFYSLGNFIFDTNYQRAHLYTDVGVLLKLIFTEEKLDFEAMGIQIIHGLHRYPRRGVRLAVAPGRQGLRGGGHAQDDLPGAGPVHQRASGRLGRILFQHRARRLLRGHPHGLPCDRPLRPHRRGGRLEVQQTGQGEGVYPQAAVSASPL